MIDARNAGEWGWALFWRVLSLRHARAVSVIYWISHHSSRTRAHSLRTGPDMVDGSGSDIVTDVCLRSSALGSFSILIASVEMASARWAWERYWFLISTAYSKGVATSLDLLSLIESPLHTLTLLHESMGAVTTPTSRISSTDKIKWKPFLLRYRNPAHSYIAHTYNISLITSRSSKARVSSEKP